MFTSIVCFIGPSLLNVSSIFLTYMGLSIFFNLNLLFLVSSKLITRPTTPLSKSVSTITLSYILIISNPICYPIYWICFYGDLVKVLICYMQVHLSENNIPVVKPPPNHTSLPSMAATFLAICLMVVLQPSRYSVTNFIQLISPQPVDRFLQTKLH